MPHDAGVEKGLVGNLHGVPSISSVNSIRTTRRSTYERYETENHSSWAGQAEVTSHLECDKLPDQHSEFVQRDKCTLDELVRVCLSIVMCLQSAAYWSQCFEA